MEGIALLDENGIYYYLNPVHLSMFGYDHEHELIGKSWQHIYEEDEIWRINADIFPILRKNGHWRGETTGKHKHGNPVYQEISLAYMDDGGIVCITKDISERIKQTKQAQLLNEILEQTNSMIIVTNAHREIVWVNKAFESTTGYKLEEALGKNPGSLLQGPGSDTAAIDRLRKAIAENRPFDEVLINYTKDRKAYWAQIKGKPIFNKKGVPEFYFAIQDDITKERCNELQLYENNLKLELAIGALKGGIWEWDVPAQKVLYSTSFLNLIGYTEQEAAHTFAFFEERLHPAERENVLHTLEKMIHSGSEGYQTEFRLQHRSGNYLYVLDRGIITERSASGAPLKITGITVDITDLKTAQELALQWEERYRKSLEASGAAIWEWNLKSDQVTVTTSFLKLFGLSDDWANSVSFSALARMIHPEDLMQMHQVFDRHFKGELALMEVEYRQKHPDSEEYEWYLFTGSVVEWDEEGEPVRALGYTTSVEKRKRAEAQLNESNQKLKIVVEASGVALWEWNIAGDRIVAGNDYAKLFGYDSFEQMPAAFSEQLSLLHPEDIPEVQQSLQAHFNGETPLLNLEYRVRMHSTATYRWFNAKGRVITRNENNEPVFAAGLIHDIQERKEAELALQNARLLAEASIKAKRRFLANMSHELRTPLHAINGLANHLMQTNLDEKQKGFVQLMHESGEGLVTIINDILDYSKIEEGKLTLQTVLFNPSRIFYSVCSLLESQAVNKGLRFKIESVSTELNNTFIGDPDRLRQVLLNIIGNAVKFTDYGMISVSFILHKDGDMYQLEFRCVDTGIGMSDEMKSKLFQEFSQEDESFQRKYGGSGLGLSITQELVKLMKGTFSINSQKGRGTNISIVIPIQKATVAAPVKNNGESKLSKACLEKACILAVEDNNLNRILLKIILEKHKLRYDFALNGKEALDLMRRKQYTLVLMDIQMPEMDGLEATRYIRQELNSQVPVIAMTANAVKEELNSYLENGMNHYLVKPFDEESLMQLIEQHHKPDNE